ncbi:hypothetical protein QE385_001107 [Sphingomonas sp. SORGH_AS 950]|uniref:hypothetical protein n=1 Tax=Sphingomonas sp. SORGH_AS_0950 TaxID=3041792 RepID=UPI00278434E9|nr:hypothetical protein [Sphingomonas sp. SORGH_AS_0950]MDQ1156780.1 hypothetical protein [Sphingomonas sp. SORGH_AS_0950]
MKATEPLALNHSWPLFEQGMRFDLGRPDAPDITQIDADDEWLAARGIGRWHCDLMSQHLRWSQGVYDLFDWRLGRVLERSQILPYYSSESCSAVERLRYYAIRHRRGFTIDALIRVSGVERWMRIIGAPECQNGRTVAIHGWKMDVTTEYR